MQNKRTWLYLILMLILFTLICAQQQQINDLRDDLSALQEQTVQIEKQLDEHITPPLPAEILTNKIFTKKQRAKFALCFFSVIHL